MSGGAPCLEPIPRCVEAGKHEPVCRCILEDGHKGPHASKDYQPPMPPKGNGGIGHSSERTELTVNDMTQHVYQHQAEPRDFEYRTKALEFAISVLARHAKVYTSAETIKVAARIEDYLRNGETK